MKSVFVTMVYANVAVFRAGMQALKDTATPERHILLDQHYPLGHTETLSAMKEYLAGSKIAELWDAGKNLGLHEGLNYIFARLEKEGTLQDEDVIFAYDADEGPLRKGWSEAMLRIFDADPKCGWLSLTAQGIDDQLNSCAVPVQVVGGEQVRVPNFNLMNVLCGWRVGAIRAAGVFTEPYAYYGGLEIAMQPKFRDAGYWVGWLPEYKTQPQHVLSDKNYEAYKRAHVGHTTPVFPGSFEEYLLTLTP